MINHFNYHDKTIDFMPEYKGQIHTDYGDRGRQIISGIKHSDLYQAVSVAIKQCCRDEAEFEKIPIDVEAVAQNLGCLVEKMMGLFPNVPDLRTPDADDGEMPQREHDKEIKEVCSDGSPPVDTPLVNRKKG